MSLFRKEEWVSASRGEEESASRKEGRWREKGRRKRTSPSLVQPKTTPSTPSTAALTKFACSPFATVKAPLSAVLSAVISRAESAVARRAISSVQLDEVEEVVEEGDAPRAERREEVEV